MLCVELWQVMLSPGSSVSWVGGSRWDLMLQGEVEFETALRNGNIVYEEFELDDKCFVLCFCQVD